MLKKNSAKRLIAKITVSAVLIISVLLLLIFCCIGFFVNWDLAVSLFSNPTATYQTVKAAIYGLSNDVGKIEDEIKENNKNIEEAIGNAGFTMSEEMLDKLNNGGELSQDQIIDMILGNNPESPPHSNETETDSSLEVSTNNEASEHPPNGDIQDTPSLGGSVDTLDTQPVINTDTAVDTEASEIPETQPSDTAPKKSEEEYNRKVAEYIAKVYVLKAEFTGKLSEFEQNIKAQYNALPKEERTNATKAKIVGDNYAYIAGMEMQCDAQMDSIAASLLELMKEYGKDASLVDAIYDAYNKEKELKKAYYTGLYK